MRPGSRHVKVWNGKKNREIGIPRERRSRKTKENPTQIKLNPQLIGTGYKFQERDGQKCKSAKEN